MSVTNLIQCYNENCFVDGFANGGILIELFIMMPLPQTFVLSKKFNLDSLEENVLKCIINRSFFPQLYLFIEMDVCQHNHQYTMKWNCLIVYNLALCLWPFFKFKVFSFFSGSLPSSLVRMPLYAGSQGRWRTTLIA